jgi:hypothetical protein
MAAGRFKVEYRDKDTSDNDWNLEREDLVEDFAEATYELVMDLYGTSSRAFAMEVLRGWVLGGMVAESTAVDHGVTWRFTYVAG